ncbi:MAG: HVO_0476 family zinc finger protein [Haloarculaceae archaeon]
MSDTSTSERVAVGCPACSPDVETVHEVLNSGGGRATVRCTDCDHVHKVRLPEPETVRRDVVVSQDGDSVPATVEVPAEETLAVGEEFLLETDEAIMTVRITSLELESGRSEAADAADVRTVWTRAVGNVAVNATVHPKDGAHDETRSETLHVPGDYEFVVGEADELGEEAFTVEGIYLREDAHGYDFEKLDHDGDAAVAKDVKRLYVRDETTTAWSAW